MIGLYKGDYNAGNLRGSIVEAATTYGILLDPRFYNYIYRVVIQYEFSLIK